MLAKLIAVVIHEVRTELRKLDVADSVPDGADQQRYDPASTTAADIERASTWDHDARPPICGFTSANRSDA